MIRRHRKSLWGISLLILLAVFWTTKADYSYAAPSEAAAESSQHLNRGAGAESSHENASHQGGAHSSPIVPVLLSLMVVLLAAKVGGDVAIRLKQPEVLGELTVGDATQLDELSGYGLSGGLLAHHRARVRARPCAVSRKVKLPVELNRILCRVLSRARSKGYARFVGIDCMGYLP